MGWGWGKGKNKQGTADVAQDRTCIILKGHLGGDIPCFAVKIPSNSNGFVLSLVLCYGKESIRLRVETWISHLVLLPVSWCNYDCLSPRLKVEMPHLLLYGIREKDLEQGTNSCLL